METAQKERPEAYKVLIRTKCDIKEMKKEKCHMMKVDVFSWGRGLFLILKRAQKRI